MLALAKKLRVHLPLNLTAYVILGKFLVYFIQVGDEVAVHVLRVSECVAAHSRGVALYDRMSQAQRAVHKEIQLTESLVYLRKG